MDDSLIAVNPDPDSRLPYLLRLPFGGAMVFRTSGIWPRTKAVYCYPVDVEDWPAEPDIVERVPVRSCVRRGAAIDLVSTGRGRTARSWCSPPPRPRCGVLAVTRTRKQARPHVTTPTARASGIAALEIVVDTREQYAYRFRTQQVRLTKRALPCGDYGVTNDGRLIAVVERKSLPDLVSSLANGRSLPPRRTRRPARAAVVVEDRYSQIFKLDRIRPAVVADGLAELGVRWPGVPIVFCENRQPARNGPTATWPPPTPGPPPSTPSPTASAATWSQWRPRPRPPRPSRPLPSFAPGHGRQESTCPTGDDVGPRSGRRGATPTPRTSSARKRIHKRDGIRCVRHRCWREATLLRPIALASCCE